MTLLNSIHLQVCNTTSFIFKSYGIDSVLGIFTFAKLESTEDIAILMSIYERAFNKTFAD